MKPQAALVDSVAVLAMGAVAVLSDGGSGVTLTALYGMAGVAGYRIQRGAA